MTHTYDYEQLEEIAASMNDDGEATPETRIQAAMTSREISKIDLANKIGASRSTIHNLLNALKKSPHIFNKKLNDICNELSLDRRWVQYGLQRATTEEAASNMEITGIHTDPKGHTWVEFVQHLRAPCPKNMTLTMQP